MRCHARCSQRPGTFSVHIAATALLRLPDKVGANVERRADTCAHVAAQKREHH